MGCVEECCWWQTPIDAASRLRSMRSANRQELSQARRAVLRHTSWRKMDSVGERFQKVEGEVAPIGPKMGLALSLGWNYD